MGLYPQICQSTFGISSPVFDQVVIHRDVGDVNVIAYNNSATNVYVDHVMLNGVRLNTWVIPQSLIRSGPVTLEYFMTDVAPSKSSPQTQRS